MDPLTALLDGPRASGAFVLRAMLSPPWSLRIADESPLAVVAMLRGEACVLPDQGDAHLVGTGDVAVIRGTTAYTLADEPGRAPQIVVHPGQRCTTPDGVDLHEALALGQRMWGTDPEGSTTMVVGVYAAPDEVTQPLLDTLPHTIVLPAARTDQAMVDLLAREMADDSPGHQAVLDRLLDVLLVSTLRAWFEHRPDEVPQWYRAYRDADIGPVIRAMHEQPARRWTVASLAAAAGMSRASFARHFTEVVGEPPMTHLTSIRLALAAELLCRPGSHLAAVARQVGYRSPYALSAAFTRVRGLSPSAHRSLARHAPRAGR